MPDTVVLRAAGVGLVLAVSGRGLPRVAHWGADPGALDPDEAGVLAGGVSAAAAQVGGADPYAIPLLPAQWDGWVGRPGATGERTGRWQHLRLALTGSHFHYGNHVEYESADPDAGVTVDTRLVLDRHGVVRLRHAVTNDGPDTWTVAALRCLLPVPDRAAELFDLTGRWALERLPQRMPFAYGTHARDGRRGRTGHDAPTLLVAGTPGFGDGHGEVWSVHTGWSGDTEHYAERINGATAVIGGAELLAPGEIRLGPGETYETPEVWFVWSDQGLDGLSDRLHRTIRARPGHPRTPRPLTLNVWEAVYFDHDLDRLRALADRAAEIGVERYVLDDGWFRGRRDDSAGLGDWEVDPAVWPDGLHPLVDHVRAKGMQFGLWFEPEMVNPDSDLARAHPDWLLTPAGRPARPERRQQVLDLARPEVADLLFARIDALVTEYGIDYVKWDHNRDVLEAAAGAHRQTAGAYALLDRLRAAHPALEIESCASGGGRVDLGILARTDRVWASDSNDPVDRQAIQRGTALLLPPELVGSHVGPSPAHVSGRATGLEFRCATALVGHAGIEWDITRCTPEELATLTDWIRLYRRVRDLLHTGRSVHSEQPDPHARLYGVVAHDRSAALYVRAQLDSPLELRPERVRLPGLDPARRYRVTTCWGAAGVDGVVLPGSALGAAGLLLPPLRAIEASVLEVRAV
jgi:alpha-galactosidase